MLIELLVSIVFLFLLLACLMIFFIRHKSKVPYYRLTKEQCVDLLVRAVQGYLPEHEWHAFIGMNIRDNEALDVLREQCLLLDEFGVRGTCLVDGHSCVSFNKSGIQRLEVLLDEWRFKTDYLV
ncbi:hypothetical protein A8139_20205 [Marinomonas primoryensis]|jgi:hypothetical protein|uniref:Uncharacterized protein n=2 Tax=Marinomonas primoryensis TaxID=178399 RepID=A0A2Z4PWQ7_9GAMM|nr:hypothetical protein A8139_20205 [Marinomonas primoryensis]